MYDMCFIRLSVVPPSVSDHAAATTSWMNRSFSTAAGGITNGYPSANPMPRFRLFSTYVSVYQSASHVSKADGVSTSYAFGFIAGSPTRFGLTDSPHPTAVSSVSLMCR